MDSGEQFYRDTWAEIDLDAIKGNIKKMRLRLPAEVKLMAVVKANAYGHGDVQVAKVALEEGASSLAVAFLDEALALRQKGIEAPILVLGYTRPANANLAAVNGIALTVFQEEWLDIARLHLNHDEPLNVHLKLDTGMGRLGVRDTKTLQTIEARILQQSGINLEGVYTHFATADSRDDSYFEQQLKTFYHMLTFLKTKPLVIHASNSAASLKGAAYFNSIRYGISMYGLSPSIDMKTELPFQLKEAFSLRTRIVHVKKLLPGEKISYGTTYEAKEEEWIGTLPIGYADGWLRKLQGQEVLIGGMRVPIVGRICMDQCMIKLPRELPIGTMVTLIGEDGGDSIPIDEIANRLETINYEVPCLISNRVPRVYIEPGKNKEIVNRILKF